jgi:hypothetical protein
MLTFSRPAAGRLTLDGTFRSRPVRLNLQLDDLGALPLAKGGFHWIQEYPLNR